MKAPTIFLAAAVGLFTSSCEPQQAAKSVLPVGAASAAPKAVINHNGTPQRRVGDLIHLDSHKSTGEAFKWYVDTSGVEVPSDNDDSQVRDNAAELRRMGFTVIEPQEDTATFEVLERDVFLASYPGVYRVILAAASNTDDGIQTDVTGYNVTVGNGTPEPPPPTDEPDPPKITFGLAKLVPGWLATVPDAAKGNKQSIAEVLAVNAKLAAEGRFNTLQEIQQAVGVGLSAAITDKKAWGKFGAEFTAAIDALQKSGKIQTPADFGKAIGEVAGAM